MRIYRGGGGVCARTDRPEIGIQTGPQLIQKGLHLLDLGLVEKAPSEGPSEPVSCFEQRPPGDSDKSSIVLVASPTKTLRDIGTNAVFGTHELASNGVPGKRVPVRCDVPRRIGDPFRQSIDTEIFERDADSLGTFLHGVPIIVSKTAAR